MAHLITLDLDTIPDLRNQQPKLRDARAVAFFINDFKKTFGATEPTSRETALVPLSEEPIAFCDWTGEGIENGCGSHGTRDYAAHLTLRSRRMGSGGWLSA